MQNTPGANKTCQTCRRMNANQRARALPVGWLARHPTARMACSNSREPWDSGTATAFPDMPVAACGNRRLPAAGPL